MEHAGEGFFRLTPGGMVRLKHAYIIKCENVGRMMMELSRRFICTYVAESKSGNDQSGLKVKSVIHWVNATAVTAEVRLGHDKLFTVEAPDAQDDDFKSLSTRNPCKFLVIPK